MPIESFDDINFMPVSNTLFNLTLRGAARLFKLEYSGVSQSSEMYGSRNVGPEVWKSKDGVYVLLAFRGSPQSEMAILEESDDVAADPIPEFMRRYGDDMLAEMTTRVSYQKITAGDEWAEDAVVVVGGGGIVPANSGFSSFVNPVHWLSSGPRLAFQAAHGNLPDTWLFNNLLGSVIPAALSLNPEDGSELLTRRPVSLIIYYESIMSALLQYFDPENTNPAEVTLSNDNKTSECIDFMTPTAVGARPQSAGKWYAEFTLDAVPQYCGAHFGLCTIDHPLTEYIGNTNTPYSWSFSFNEHQDYGRYWHENTGDYLWNFELNQGGVVQLAADLDTGKIWVGVNGVWYDSADPAAGTGAIFSGAAISNTFLAVTLLGEGTKVTMRLLESEFSYAMPAGFSAWGAFSASGAANEVTIKSDASTLYSGPCVSGDEIALAWDTANDLPIDYIEFSFESEEVALITDIQFNDIGATLFAG